MMYITCFLRISTCEQYFIFNPNDVNDTRGFDAAFCVAMPGNFSGSGTCRGALRGCCAAGYSAQEVS